MLSVRAELGFLVNNRPSPSRISRQMIEPSNKSLTVDAFAQSCRNWAWCPSSSSGTTGNGIKEEHSSNQTLHEYIKIEAESSHSGENGIVDRLGVNQKQQVVNPQKGLLQLVSLSDTNYILLL